MLRVWRRGLSLIYSLIRRLIRWHDHWLTGRPISRASPVLPPLDEPASRNPNSNCTHDGADTDARLCAGAEAPVFPRLPLPLQLLLRGRRWQPEGAGGDGDDARVLCGPEADLDGRGGDGEEGGDGGGAGAVSVVSSDPGV